MREWSQTTGRYLMPTLSEKLEIIVQADTWNTAVKKLESVGIDEKSKITRRNINKLFMVSVTTDKANLTDDFYEKIKKHKNISIVTDSASWRRNREVLNEIYLVENELRKLLLHIFDLVETFYEIFSKTQYAKTLAKHQAITFPNHLDPLTSRLMLGEMIDLLEFDLSWAKKDISAKGLSDLLTDASDLTELKAKLQEKLKPKVPWDIISENVLTEPVKWGEVKPQLEILKEFRNKAAHFQIITETEKDDVIKSAKEVYKKLTKRKAELSKAQQDAITIMTKGYATQMTSFAKQIQDLVDAARPSLATMQAFASINSQTVGIAAALAAIKPLALTEAAQEAIRRNLSPPNIPPLALMSSDTATALSKMKEVNDATAKINGRLTE